MDNRFRIRYGRVDNQPKNTLVTMREGDKIFFGIARCRLNKDRVNKEEGKRLAQFRANLAACNIANLLSFDGTLAVNKTGVFGVVNVDERTKMIEYFKNIDSISAKKGNQ